MSSHPHFVKQAGDLSGRTGYEWVAITVTVVPWLLGVACYVLVNAG